MVPVLFRQIFSKARFLCEATEPGQAGRQAPGSHRGAMLIDRMQESTDINIHTEKGGGGGGKTTRQGFAFFHEKSFPIFYKNQSRRMDGF